MSETDPPRVAEARRAKEQKLAGMCKKAGVPYPPTEIFIRAFKAENELEIWAAPKQGLAMVLLAKYEIAAQSGGLGPKRTEGDRQVPEGFYHIDRFNPQSRFHLSLGLNYPNAADRILSDKEKPGGDIFIHGNKKSIGCMAMTDDKIQEIYLLADGARASGQSKIPVHVFPMRMNRANAGRLAQRSKGDDALSRLWTQIQKGYDAFESTRRPPKIAVRRDGSYVATAVKPKAE